VLSVFRALIRVPLAAMQAHGAAPPGAAGLTEEPATAADLMAALAERDHIIQRVEEFLAGYDAWICPAAPVAAFPHRPIGEPILLDGVSVPSQVIDHPCVLATLTGNPALVLPIARDRDRLPIGAQLIGRRWRDEDLLALGQAVLDLGEPLPAPEP
jgi:amidase